MRSILDEFTKELDDLVILLESIKPVNNALATHPEQLVRRYVLVRRRFDYAAFAVALYASFETFVEDLVGAYAHLESRRLSYKKLPQKLQDKHLSRTAEMLSPRKRIGEGRYAGMSELEVVRNLFECLDGGEKYTLNKAAVIAHDMNLRVDEINRMFAAVGIEDVCNRVRRADALLAWYRNENGLDDLQDVPERDIEERIKELVERRNQIAHGGGIPNDLLGEDKMRDAVAFLRAFANSIYAIVVGCYLKAHHAESADSVKLVYHNRPIKNGTVVVVEKPANRLFVGQPLFVASDAGARWGRIQSLRVDDSEVQVIGPEVDAPQGIGIELNFVCPRKANLVALGAEDDLVWSPPEPAKAPAT